MKKKEALHDEISRVAYEFYEARDRAHGHDLADWFAAEKIVMEKHERHEKETGQGLDITRKGEKVFPTRDKKSGHGYI